MLIHHFSFSESRVLGAPLEPAKSRLSQRADLGTSRARKRAPPRAAWRNGDCVASWSELQSDGLAVIAFSKTLSKSRAAGPVSRCHF